MTRVLHDPAPASNRTGPSTDTMPSRCCGFIFARRSATFSILVRLLVGCRTASGSNPIEAETRQDRRGGWGAQAILLQCFRGAIVQVVFLRENGLDIFATGTCS